MVKEAVKEENAEILIVAAKIESEIAEFDSYEDKQMFLEEIGLEESGVNRLIKAAYKLLDLEKHSSLQDRKKCGRGHSAREARLHNAQA